MKTRKAGATGASQLRGASVRFSFGDEGVGARKALPWQHRS